VENIIKPILSSLFGVVEVEGSRSSFSSQLTNKKAKSEKEKGKNIYRKFVSFGMKEVCHFLPCFQDTCCHYQDGKRNMGTNTSCSDGNAK
jgi:hypothetical protein